MHADKEHGVLTRLTKPGAWISVHALPMSGRPKMTEVPPCEWHLQQVRAAHSQASSHAQRQTVTLSQSLSVTHSAPL